MLNLPVPPSVNALYANRKAGKGGYGRYKTATYTNWLRDADAHLQAQKPAWLGKRIDGPVKLHIQVPAGTRGDIDNRMKAGIDLLVSREITHDDRHHHKVSIERADVSCCVVTIEPWVAA